jgi:hypothetical protein
MRRELLLTLEQAAGDLDAVEQGLKRLIRHLPQALEFDQTPAEEIPYQSPHLPRCTEWSKVSHRPCHGPASRHYGLCANHFRWLFGHLLNYYHNEDFVACTLCGREWRRGTAEVGLSMHEICPQHAPGLRAMKILRDHRERIA